MIDNLDPKDVTIAALQEACRTAIIEIGDWLRRQPPGAVPGDAQWTSSRRELRTQIDLLGNALDASLQDGVQ